MFSETVHDNDNFSTPSKEKNAPLLVLMGCHSSGQNCCIDRDSAPATFDTQPDTEFSLGHDSKHSVQSCTEKYTSGMGANTKTKHLHSVYNFKLHTHSLVCATL